MDAARRQKLEGEIPAIVIIMQWQDFCLCDMIDECIIRGIRFHA